MAELSILMIITTSRNSIVAEVAVITVIFQTESRGAVVR
jgi:hypothetical protein